ncbi:MAG: site-specific DNA-methyltransferase [Deltaproteobacteria bacterium]|nr:site-specific DNA-methyltransferase [Deltaproteobacteria bacterium]
MSDGVKVEIKPAKGRPMLTWVGKRPLRQVTAFPAQHIETFNLNHGRLSGSAPRPAWTDWPVAYPQGGLLFHGDNKEVLAHLLANGFRGKVKLIYIDPPFDSGADYVRKVSLRGVKGAAKIEGEGYTLGEQIQYTDIWANDNYLQFMYERLLLLKEMLTEDGFSVVHMNSRRVHYVKAMMDEIFGESNFRNEIIIKRIRKSYTEKTGIASLNEGVDYLLFYSKSPETRMRPPLKYAPKEERWHSFDAPNIRPNLTYELFGKWPPPGRCWMKSPGEADKMIEHGDLRPNPSTGWPEYRIEASEHIVRDTLWDDVTGTAFTTDYPTEKKEGMLNLILGMASEPHDIILDCFIGSGTTAVAAQKLGRRWIGCDINKGAIQTTCKRLQNVILEQMEAAQKKNKQQPLPPAGEEAQVNSDPPPAQFSFAVYRVNDYDLAIQHNEAVNLACEHLGITRTKTDAFFDGTLGKKLVKIVPFGHPLTLLDLEEIKRELSARPEEERDICVVCLGKETAADGWLEDWNRLRKQGDVPNKIEVIELRTDPRYGKFFVHQPATARVSITRDQGKISVEIQDFISPTILERLRQHSGLLTPQIDDWRAMVDSVMIDPAYNGEVFNVAFADVPAKKSDLVAGAYELDAPTGETTVAVKITDMLGEEVLITQKI